MPIWALSSPLIKLLCRQGRLARRPENPEFSLLYHEKR